MAARKVYATLREKMDAANARRKVKRAIPGYYSPLTKEKKNEYNRARRFKLYGLPEADYHAMIERQGGVCAVCRDSMPSPQIDHCHATGKVRGILCSNCNIGLGQFKDNTDRMLAGIAYLRSHQ